MKQRFFLLTILIVLTILSGLGICFAESTPGEKDLLAVVNKWHNELYDGLDYKRLVPVYIACLMDPVPYEVVKELDLEQSKPTQKIRKLSTWINQSLAHTQMSPEFKDYPGREPWGMVNGYPSYKKMLPSEMKAMSGLTGKITGECTSLAHFNACLFTIAGVGPENLVLLRLSNHTIGLIKFNDKYYMLDNMNVKLITEEMKAKLKRNMFFEGVYNSSFGFKSIFFISDSTFFDKNNTITDSLETVNKLDLVKSRFDISLPEYAGREQLLSEVFGPSQFSKSELAQLIRYAYLSLNVEHPEVYLKASLRAPLVKDLAKKVSAPDEIFQWIKQNITIGSIFSDEQDRIMLSDQVILFKKGSLKDRALLAYTLLKMKNYNPTLIICQNNSFIELDGRYYDARDFKVLDSIQDNIRIKLSI